MGKGTMMTQANYQETIQISGHLGPINATITPLNLEISPLTVFIGPQGTGKSLVSQLLYSYIVTEIGRAHV